MVESKMANEASKIGLIAAVFKSRLDPRTPAQKACHFHLTIALRCNGFGDEPILGCLPRFPRESSFSKLGAELDRRFLTRG